MSRLRTCKECGVPRRFTKEHEWLNNGTIVQRENPEHRMIFIENDNVTSTFAGIEEIIGMSIERIITEAKRRATYDFVDHMLPDVVKAVVRLVGVRPVIGNITSLGKVMGYGSIALESIRRVHGKGDYVTLRCREIYSLPLFNGDFAGSFNAIDRREVGIVYEVVGEDEYGITGNITPHPLELQERLQTREYTNKEGDIEFERCPRCGAPLALSRFQWYPERGVILDRERGRRMAAMGPASLDAIIEELEKELGETIPEVVIEAERRFVRGGYYSVEEFESEEGFRRELALRGMGNLKEIAWREDGARLRMENPCLDLVLVGMMQGMLELLTGRESKVQWEITADGDLVVEATVV